MKLIRENELVRTSSETDAAGVKSANITATVNTHCMMLSQYYVHIALEPVG